MTTPAAGWDIADADVVGSVTWWLNHHPRLTQAAGGPPPAGGPPRASTVNAPPFPRWRISDSTDLRGFTGLTSNRLTIEVLGDLDGRISKPALRRLAIATAEALDEMRTVPEVQGCVITNVEVSSVAWSPLPPSNQPRYVLSPVIASHPAW